MKISWITFKTIIKDTLQTILQGRGVSTRHTLSGSLCGSSLSVDSLQDAGFHFFFLFFLLNFLMVPCLMENNFMLCATDITNSIISQNQNSGSLSKHFVFKFHPTERLCLTTLKWLRAVFLTGVRIFPKET